MPCFFCYRRSKQQNRIALLALALVKSRQLKVWKTLCNLYGVGNIFSTLHEKVSSKGFGLLFQCNTFLSHMRSSESHVHLFLVSNVLKLDMVFPLLPALRSLTTLTSAGKITLYFLWSLQKGFHFLYNPGHLRKDL